MNVKKISMVALAAVACVGLTVGLSACTNPASFLSSLSLSIVQQNGGEYFDLTSVLDLGNVSLAELNVGIIDPHTGAQEGTIEFTQLANGKSQISLLANTALIPNASSSLGRTMPNGNPIPAVLGASSGDVLGIPIINNSILYMGGNTNSTAYVGVALDIPGFDNVMNHLSTAVNVFFMGNFPNGVLGVAGIYGSTVANESGIAIFAKYTKPVAIGASARALSRNPTAAQAAQNDYAIEKLNSYNQNKLMKFFYQGKKRTLRVN